MKKFLSIALAIVMMLALSVTAFADDAPSATHEAITVAKEYTVSGGDGKTIPSETLSFTVEANKNNPDTSLITVGDVDTSKGLDITIEFPNYTKMGVYKYTVTENKGDTLGVTYDETAIEVVVTVINEKAGDGTENELKVYVAVFSLTEDGEQDQKIGGDEPTSEDAAFTNEYGVGQLTVSKKVTGNLSDNTKPFDILVTFNGGEKAGNAITFSVAGGDEQTLTFGEDGTVSTTITLKHGDSAVFTNIPAGVTYTVVEAEKHTTGDLNSDEGYTATYANSDNQETGSGSGGIEAEDKDTVEITNEKKTEIQTGISLDSIPYILIAVVVVAALFIMAIRKRRYADD
ncbi:MAG: hypothetical protein IJV41_04870 [Oscillospiraceae bacterium]|nr:hypothetical protein [Oscillospiraceae bacterium]